MKTATEIRDMMLEIRNQGEPYESGPIRDTLYERSMALAWVLDYPEVPTMILADEQIKLLECF